MANTKIKEDAKDHASKASRTAGATKQAKNESAKSAGSKTKR